MRRGTLCVAFVAAVFSVSGFLVSPAAALDSDPTWGSRETVSTHGSVTYQQGSERYLAYDHHGVPGIAHATPYGMYFELERRVPNLGWAYVVGGGLDSAICPTHAYDRHERPAVCYVDAVDSRVAFVSFDGTQWGTEFLSDYGGVGNYASMAYDLYGRPAVAYTSSGDYDLRYVCDTDGDGDWSDETYQSFQAGYQMGGYGDVKLAFDAQNRPVVAFWGSDMGVRTLYVAAREGGYFPAVPLATTTSEDLRLSLAVEPQTGYAAVAYADSRGILTYANWDGDQWESEELGPGMYPSLAFDPADGAPVIACMEPRMILMLYYWDSDDERWVADVVDPQIGVGLLPSLAFNPYGDDPMGVAYLDESGNVYYIQDPPAVPEPATLALMAAGLGGLVFGRRHRFVAA